MIYRAEGVYTHPHSVEARFSMRIDLRCRHCQSKLSVKAELHGKQIGCPKCGNPVRVSLAPVVLPQLGNRPGGSPMMAVPVEEEPVWAEPILDVADFEVLPDEEPVAVPRSVKPKPARAVTPKLVDEDEEEDTPRPRKKKKKKSNANEATSIPVWMWIVGGLLLRRLEYTQGRFVVRLLAGFADVFSVHNRARLIDDEHSSGKQLDFINQRTSSFAKGSIHIVREVMQLIDGMGGIGSESVHGKG